MASHSLIRTRTLASLLPLAHYHYHYHPPRTLTRHNHHHHHHHSDSANFITTATVLSSKKQTRRNHHVSDVTAVPMRPERIITTISDGQESQDEEERRQVLAEFDALIDCGWRLDEERRGVYKVFHFQTYTKVADFHHSIAVRSKSKNHHPKMITEKGSLTVYWTTHHPRGFSIKDTFMARYCDELAAVIGTVDPSDVRKCGLA